MQENEIVYNEYVESVDFWCEHSSKMSFTLLVTPSDTLIRRSISQQKTGVSITIDDPVRTARLPSPPRGNVSNIVHVCNLVNNTLYTSVFRTPTHCYYCLLVLCKGLFKEPSSSGEAVYTGTA